MMKPAAIGLMSIAAMFGAFDNVGTMISDVFARGPLPFSRRKRMNMLRGRSQRRRRHGALTGPGSKWDDQQ